MPTEFIPNQAVLFENPIGTYDCLNNDPRAYAQLAQPGDTLCVQWKMLPCTEDVSCEPDMVIDPLGADLLQNWNTGTGWTSSGSTSAIYDGTGGAGNLDQTINTTAGKVYMFTLTVNGFTGDADFEVALGLDVRGPITGDGTYTYYFVAVGALTTITLIPTGPGVAGDYFELDQMSMIQYTDCWEDGLSSGTASWTYSYENGQGKFCSFNYNGGNLYNRDAYVTDGNYHKVTFTISGWSQGSVNVTLGGVSLGAATGEGTWVFYGTPTDVSKDLIFQKQDLFDGCISQVTVDDYGNLTTRYNAYLVDQSNNVAASMTPSYYDDRAVVCEDWNTIDPDMSGLDCDYFKFRIVEECEDEVIDIYNSVNYFSYNLNGWDCSKVVEAWSEGYAFGFYFGSDIDNPDFKLYQRLRVLQFSPKYPNVGEEYLYSNGSTARSYAQTGKRRICWFDYIDENAHDTIRVQLLSQKLLIDNYAFYFPTADYEPEWAENGKYNLAQSRVELEHEQVLFGTTCGTQANSICPPQLIPMTYSEVRLYGVISLLGFTLSNVQSWWSSYDETGTKLYSGSNIYNLSLIAGRAALASDLQSGIDLTFGTTSAGTVTLSGTDLTIDITGTISSGSPVPVLSVTLQDNATFFVSDLLGTIPS
jgi:hypothetical protein